MLLPKHFQQVSDDADADTLGVSLGTCEEATEGLTQVMFLTSTMASTRIVVESFTEIAVTTKPSNTTIVCETICKFDAVVKHA